MASSYSPNLNLELQATGEDTGAWGQNLNNNVFSIIDAVLGNTFTLPLSGTDVTLTTSQTQNNFIHLTGTLTTNVNVIFPQIGRTFFVKNDTTGSFTVTLKTSAAGTPTTATVAQGGSSFVVLDGTNVYSAGIGFTPVQQGGGTGQGTNKLYVGWNSANSALYLQIDSTTFGGIWPIGISGGANSTLLANGSFFLNWDGANSRYSTNAGFYISGNLAVGGTITSTGDITYSSDRVWKENIRAASGCLDRVKKMIPVLYSHKPSGREKLGLIAQDMEEISPLYVRKDDKGYLTLDIASILADLAGAIGELA